MLSWVAGGREGDGAGGRETTGNKRRHRRGARGASAEPWWLKLGITSLPLWLWLAELSRVSLACDLP